jgi:hypothetical protein
MSEIGWQHRTCRIVVGLRPAINIDAPIEAATLLAAAIQAQIVGLYVEEDALRSLAALPFARVVSYGATQSIRLTEEAMTKAIARGAETSRAALAARAEKARVSWSFSIEEGELPSRMRSILATGDFLVLSEDKRAFGTEQLIRALRSAPRNVQGVVLTVSHDESRPSGPVIAIDDGDQSGRDTVRLAARIAAASHRPLQLFVIASSNDDAGRIVERARSLLLPDQEMQTCRFPPGSPELISASFGQFNPSFIVADQQGEPFGDDRTARVLLRAARAPVALLRSQEAPAAKA